MELSQSPIVYIVAGLLVLLISPLAKLVGLGLVIYGGYMMYKNAQKDEKKDDDAPLPPTDTDDSEEYTIDFEERPNLR